MIATRTAEVVGSVERRARGIAALVLAMIPSIARGEDAPPASAESTIKTTVEAGEADAEEPRRKVVTWNEWDWSVSTFRIGFGFLGDAAAYSQDAESKQQLTMKDDVGLRDFRLIFRGRFKTERPFSWQLGYMYDGAEKEWSFA